MSWNTYQNWVTKQDAVVDTTSHFNKTSVVVDLATTKQGAYWAVRTASLVQIYCAIFRYSGRLPGRKVWIKIMSESDGPIMNDCPKRILDLASPTTNHTALNFRQTCLAVLNHKNEPRVLEGKLIRLYGNTYRVEKKHKQTHIATRLDNGRTYKLTRGQEAAAEVIE